MKIDDTVLGAEEVAVAHAGMGKRSHCDSRRLAQNTCKALILTNSAAAEAIFPIKRNAYVRRQSSLPGEWLDARTGKRGWYTSREESLRRHPPARPPAARGGWIANDEIDILRPEAMDNTNTARAQGKNERKQVTFVTSTTSWAMEAGDQCTAASSCAKRQSNPPCHSDRSGRTRSQLNSWPWSRLRSCTSHRNGQGGRMDARFYLLIYLFSYFSKTGVDSSIE